jgi:DNA-binding NarL/FixJ family response regulator
MKITILLVDDYLVTRIGLKFSLAQVENFEVVGEAGDGAAAIQQALELRPAIVLMDIGLPNISGIDAAREIKSKLPQTRVIMLTSHERDEDVLAALAAGADGYCLKTIEMDQLATAINSVQSGAVWLDPAVARFVIQNCLGAPAAKSAKPATTFPLSDRELEVLALVVDGMSNQEIAKRLIVSETTVKTHMRHIMEKLAVTDRTQAAVKALRQGLV